MLRKRLRRFFDERTNTLENVLAIERDLSKYRYLPRAYSDRGPGWGVYDCVEKRYLTDAEVKKLPSDRLMNEPRGLN